MELLYLRVWADYPPGYILVLWIIGLIGKVLGLASGSMAFVYLVKLPAILAGILRRPIWCTDWQKNGLESPAP